MEDFIQIFGWISLILFVAVALTVIIYSVVVFLSLPLRVLGTKITEEVKILKEDIDENGKLKRVRLAKKRIARDKILNQKLDEKFGEGTSAVAVDIELPEKSAELQTDIDDESEMTEPDPETEITDETE
jgi:hypothetical protein